MIGIGCNNNNNKPPDPEPGPERTPTDPEPGPERTPTQQFEYWTNLLGFDMLDVAKSADWIEKYEDEISIPDSIDFMDVHRVLELGVVMYGVIITTDHNGKYRVGKQRAFGWDGRQTKLL